MLYAVILAGGRGERFWPWSRIDRPKQILPLSGGKSMLEETVDRIVPLIPLERVKIVTGKNLAGPIVSQLSPLSERHLIVEPHGRNTAPAIGLAAVHLVDEDPDAVMVVLTADHLIKPSEEFLKTLTAAIKVAEENDNLLTFGISPTRPETGYGYIEVGEIDRVVDGIHIYDVKSFKEKPDKVTAHQLYYDQQHLWNSGMFVWKAATILQAFEQHLPELYGQLMEIASALRSTNERQRIEEQYTQMRGISIDYGVLERASNVLVVKGDFSWDDIGLWTALDRVYQRDRDHNVLVGKVCSLDTYDSIIVGDQEGVVATLGVSDLIIVKTNDAILVAHRAMAQEVKKLVAEMEKREDLLEYL